MKDASRAFGYAERAVREAAGHVEIRPWLPSSSASPRQPGERAEQVTLLREIVRGDVRRGHAAGGTLAHRDPRPRCARRTWCSRAKYYEKAVEPGRTTRERSSRSSRCTTSSETRTHFFRVLERRVEVAETDAEKKELLLRPRPAPRGQDGGHDRGPSKSTRRSSIWSSTAPRSTPSNLSTALKTAGTTSSTLYQRQLDAPGAAAADLHVKVARVASRHLKDSERAFDELEAALEIDRQHEGAVTELERVLETDDDKEQRARAASLLEPMYLIRSDYDRVIGTLSARLAASDDPQHRRELLTRLAQLYEEQKEDYARSARDHREVVPRGHLGRRDRCSSSSAWPRWPAPTGVSRRCTRPSSSR